MVEATDYSSMSYPELVSHRKDAAKMIQAAVATRKAAEKKAVAIAEAMRTIGPQDKQPFEPSDHAVVRYLERVKGMDIAAVRQEIREVAATGSPLIGDRIRVASGHVFAISGDGYITTVMPADAIVHELDRPMGAKSGKARRRHRARGAALEDITNA